MHKCLDDFWMKELSSLRNLVEGGRGTEVWCRGGAGARVGLLLYRGQRLLCIDTLQGCWWGLCNQSSQATNLDVLRVVVHNDRGLEDTLCQVSFMLARHVNPPLHLLHTNSSQLRRSGAVNG